jgi:signal transduction histidine kinase
MPSALHAAINDVDSAVLSYRRRAVMALQIAFLLASSVGLALFYSIPPILIGTGTSCVLSVVSLALAYQQRLTIATWILGAQFLLLPSSLAMSALGVYDSAMLILPAGMMSMSIIAKPVRVAWFVALNLCMAGLIFYATDQHLNGTELPESLRATLPVDGTTVMIVLVFCGLVASYISIVLSEMLVVLTRHQSELEQTVTSRTAQLSDSNEHLRNALVTLDRAKGELVQREKLASLGSLVAGVAHELNTPIGNASVAATTVQAHLRELKDKMGQGALRRSEMEQLLQLCEDGTELVVRSVFRARDLVGSFKQVSVDQSSERRRTFDLKELVTDGMRTLRPGLVGTPWVLLEEVEANIACDGQPGPLIQVLTNLVQNAILHGFDGRTGGTVRVLGQALPGDRVRITVSDDGRGIPADSLDHIFDPFFTTRLGQGGSGLGLTICHNLVTSLLGGDIKVQSTPGVGTDFILTLPRVAPQTL